MKLTNSKAGDLNLLNVHCLLITVVLFSLLFWAGVVVASETDGTIVSGGNNGYAWSDQAGWVNFGTTNGDIHITDTAITGYAWNSNYGWINMNPTNGGITVASNGQLTGYAWGSSLGWINFGNVVINSSGKFTGTATGTIIGTLTFDCTNCSVVTDYRPADSRTTTDDGGSSGGVSGGSSAPVTTTPTTPTAPIPPATGLDTDTFPPGAGGVSDDGDIIEDEDNLLPEQLFDIRLLLDQRNVERIVDLSARVTFESFGRVPTPVALTFTIIDSEGNEVWRNVDSVTVETEQVFVKRFFDAGELPDGDYVLRLHTLYNTVVEDEFEAPFTIGQTPGFNWVPWLVGGLLFLLAGLIFFWFLVARRREEKKEDGINTPYL